MMTSDDPPALTVQVRDLLESLSVWGPVQTGRLSMALGAVAPPSLWSLVELELGEVGNVNTDDVFRSPLTVDRAVDLARRWTASDGSEAHVLLLAVALLDVALLAVEGSGDAAHLAERASCEPIDVAGTPEIILLGTEEGHSPVLAHGTSASADSWAGKQEDIWAAATALARMEKRVPDDLDLVVVALAQQPHGPLALRHFIHLKGGSEGAGELRMLHPTTPLSVVEAGARASFREGAESDEAALAAAGFAASPALTRLCNASRRTTQGLAARHALLADGTGVPRLLGVRHRLATLGAGCVMLTLLVALTHVSWFLVPALIVAIFIGPPWASPVARVPVAILVGIAIAPIYGFLVFLGAALEWFANRLARRSWAEATGVVLGGFEAGLLLTPIPAIRIPRRRKRAAPK